MVQLQRQISDFEGRDIRVVASSIDSVEEISMMRSSAGADFDFLSDPAGKLLDLLAVRHVGGRVDGADIAQSASFLIAPDGTILWRAVAENYRARPDPDEILAAADRLLPVG